mgnify:CR=1 FL=1
MNNQTLMIVGLVVVLYLLMNNRCKEGFQMGDPPIIQQKEGDQCHTTTKNWQYCKDDYPNSCVKYIPPKAVKYRCNSKKHLDCVGPPSALHKVSCGGNDFGCYTNSLFQGGNWGEKGYYDPKGKCQLSADLKKKQQDAIDTKKAEDEYHAAMAPMHQENAYIGAVGALFNPVGMAKDVIGGWF